LSLSNFPLSFSRITKPRLFGVDRKRDMVLLGIFKARANSVSATGIGPFIKISRILAAFCSD
jgi:hypothetical protein